MFLFSCIQDCARVGARSKGKEVPTGAYDAPHTGMCASLMGKGAALFGGKPTRGLPVLIACMFISVSYFRFRFCDE